MSTELPWFYIVVLLLLPWLLLVCGYVLGKLASERRFRRGDYTPYEKKVIGKARSEGADAAALFWMGKARDAIKEASEVFDKERTAIEKAWEDIHESTMLIQEGGKAIRDGYAYLSGLTDADGNRIMEVIRAAYAKGRDKGFQEAEDAISGSLLHNIMPGKPGEDSDASGEGGSPAPLSPTDAPFQ